MWNGSLQSPLSMQLPSPNKICSWRPGGLEERCEWRTWGLIGNEKDWAVKVAWEQTEQPTQGPSCCSASTIGTSSPISHLLLNQLQPSQSKAVPAAEVMGKALVTSTCREIHSKLILFVRLLKERWISPLQCLQPGQMKQLLSWMWWGNQCRLSYHCWSHCKTRFTCLQPSRAVTYQDLYWWIK